MAHAAISRCYANAVCLRQHKTVCPLVPCARPDHTINGSVSAIRWSPTTTRTVGRPQTQQSTRVQAETTPSPAMSQPATPETTTIGFLGLGIMGQAMARNLDNAGFKLTVYNRDDTKSRQFVDSCSPNVCIASTPAELVAKSDITLAMLSDPEAVRSVAVGPTGVLAGIVPGKAYIDVSTVDADTARWMNECVHEKGGRFLEAPVSGSKGPAEQGQLKRGNVYFKSFAPLQVFLCGGDRDVYDQCEAVLAPLAKRTFYLGDAGAGAHMKLIVNMIMASMLTSLAEGLELAQAAGVSKESLIDVIGQGAMACPMFALKGPAMASEPPKYPTAFPLKHQAKDLRLAMALAEEFGVPEGRLRLSKVANELFAEANEIGLGDADFSAVQEAVRRSS